MKSDQVPVQECAVVSTVASLSGCVEPVQKVTGQLENMSFDSAIGVLKLCKEIATSKKRIGNFLSLLAVPILLH